MIGDILQPTHLIFILIVALVVLGPKRLPEVGRSLGRGLRDFKYALSTESPEHDYVSAPESHTASNAEPVAHVDEPPTQPAVAHGAPSTESGGPAPAAGGPAEHTS